MLIEGRSYIESIPEMHDSELFRACVEAEPGPFVDAAVKELTMERGYRREDIEDETDRILAMRAHERRIEREDWMRYGDIDLACRDGEL